MLMPPLPMHRRLMETTGNVQSAVNEWEPRVAAGGDLLPIPTHYTVISELTIHNDHLNTDVHIQGRSRFETRMNWDGIVQQERSHHFHIDRETSNYSQDDRLIDFPRNKDGAILNLDTGSTTPTEVQPGVFEFVDKRGAVFRVSKEPGEDGQTVWTVLAFDAQGSQLTTEVIDRDGKFLSATIRTENDLTNTVDGRELSVEVFKYSYDDEGRLVREARRVVYDENANDGTEQNTDFDYLRDGIISYVTKDVEGNTIRTGKRFYDDQGRFLYSVIEENIPGSNQIRKLAQRAVSYEHIRDELLPNID